MHQKNTLSPFDLREEITKYFRALSIHLRRIYCRLDEIDFLITQASSFISAGKITLASQTIEDTTALIGEANAILDYIRKKILTVLSHTITESARNVRTVYQVRYLTDSINGIYAGMVTCFILAAHEIVLASQRTLQISTITLKEVGVF